MSLFDIINLKKELSELESKTNELNFWENSKNSTKILKEINLIKGKIEGYKKVETNLQNIIEMNDLLSEEKEESLEEELLKSIKQLDKEIEKLEINTLLSQETGRTLNELYKIYDMSGMSLYGDTYDLYTAKGVKQVPFEENVNIQRYLESVKQLTANTFANMSNTTALYEPYRNLVDTAIDAVVSGVGAYNELIRAQLNV